MKSIHRGTWTVLALLLVGGRELMGFDPASHCIVIRNVTVNLPQGSLIRKALETYPGVAAWGASGPDINYAQPGKIVDYSIWADRYHSYKVGAFTARLLQDALASKDLKKIAFAAGWASHVAGDLGCHGIYVNAEAPINTPGDGQANPIHTLLEQLADPYLWTHFGKRTPTEYLKFGVEGIFSDPSELPLDLIAQASREVFAEQPEASEFEASAVLFDAALKTGIGYTYTSYFDALPGLQQNDRLARLDRAFYTAVHLSVSFLNHAEQGDYSAFTNRWNIGVGLSACPISNLHVRVSTGAQKKHWYSLLDGGTKDNVYFGMVQSDGRKVEWKLKYGISNFNAGTTDQFFLNNFDTNLHPENITQVYLRKDNPWNSMDPEWYVQGLQVDLNGTRVLDRAIGNWLDGGNPRWTSSVNWSGMSLDTGADPLVPDTGEGLVAPVPEWSYADLVAPDFPLEVPTHFGNNPLSRTIASGKPHHNGLDQILTATDPQFVEATFTYGDLQVALPDEKISLFAWSCSSAKPQWVKLGTGKTSLAGKLHFDIPAEAHLPVGITQVKAVVDGDGSEANAFLHVVAEAKRTVVFDLDGTLTTDDAQVAEQFLSDLVGGKYVAKVVPGAVPLANFYAQHGYTILYLTARPSFVGDISKKWLMELGFPFGILHTTDQVIPLQAADLFKTAYLQSIAPKGYLLERGYGNADTDITAYYNVGIAPDHTFILGTHGGDQGSTPIQGDYFAHLKDLEAHF